MRPLELTLQGFKSYRAPQAFSLEERTLFGIVGPTGAGKSSILEGLIFALYGKTPKVERDTKKLINSNEDEARVQLLFQTDSVGWEVTRVIRRKGTSQVVLNRLGGGEQVTGDRAVNTRIAELVGLDFDAFRSSVSLPQGDFDRFLRATASERSKILKGIFRLDRVDLLREGARRKVAQIEGEAKTLVALLPLLPAEPGQEAERLAKRLEESSAEVDAIREMLAEVTLAERKVAGGAEKIESLRSRQSELQQVLSEIPAADELAKIEDQLREAATKQRSIEAEVKTLSEKLAQGRRLWSEQDSGPLGSDWLKSARDVLADLKRTSKESLSQAKEVERLKAEAKAAAIPMQAAQTDDDKARSIWNEAREAFRVAQRSHAAHAIRGELSDGDICPVCEQTIVSLPDGLPSDLEEARKAAELSESSFEKKRGLAEQAKSSFALFQDRASAAAERSAATAIKLTEITAAATGLSGGREIDELIEERAAALESLKTQMQEDQKLLEEATVLERAARSHKDQLTESRVRLASRIDRIVGKLDITSVATEHLAEIGRMAEEKCRLLIDQTNASISQELDQIASAAQSLEHFRKRFGAFAEEPVAEVYAQAGRRMDSAKADLERLQAAIAAHEATAETVKALSKTKVLFERLVLDLTDSKFTAFLLDEQRRLLSELASVKLMELTGRYRFDDEGDFQIVDETTRVTRSADTLSGGETFLASLALALALAEAVSLEGGRLACFFLDEGFGSLDPEALDLAIDGIESLAVPGRVIGLISHVGGVQARLDDLIVLERAGDGSTTVAQHEGPLGYASASI